MNYSMNSMNDVFKRIFVLAQSNFYLPKPKQTLKELRHDILSHFFDGLSHGLSVGKPKTNGLLMKEKTKGVILKQKGTRMAEDGED